MLSFVGIAGKQRKYKNNTVHNLLLIIRFKLFFNCCLVNLANLESDNFENDLQAISEDITSENNTMFTSGSLSTDLDGNKINNDQQLLETIASFVNADQAETEDHESETRDDDNNIIDDDRNFALDDSMTSGDSENITDTSCRRNYIRYSCIMRCLCVATRRPLVFFRAGHFLAVFMMEASDVVPHRTPISSQITIEI